MTLPATDIQNYTLIVNPGFQCVTRKSISGLDRPGGPQQMVWPEGCHDRIGPNRFTGRRKI